MTEVEPILLVVYDVVTNIDILIETTWRSWRQSEPRNWPRLTNGCGN